MNIASDVLSACFSSARAEPIKLIEPMHKDGFKMIPAQLNVAFNSPSGTMKTSQLMGIGNKYMVRCLTYTLPAMIGSIGERGELCPGTVIEAAGKVFGLDEYHSMTYGMKKSLLSIADGQWAERRLARQVQREFTKRTKCITYGISRNRIWVKNIRMPILLSGIISPHKHSVATLDDYALGSRFMQLSFATDFDEMSGMLKGKKYFDIKVDLWEESPVFEDWCKWVDVYSEAIRALPPKIRSFHERHSEFFTRGAVLFSRLFSWASRGNSTIVDWEKYIPYISFFAYNNVTSSLTYSEFEIYQLIKQDISQKEIAQLLSVSEAFVSKVMEDLKRLGLG